MMIISQKALLDELANFKSTGMNIQKANLCILLASNFMDQAANSVYSPEYVEDISAEQLKVYSEIYNGIKTISNKLQDLSKTSTRYVQDL